MGETQSPEAGVRALATLLELSSPQPAQRRPSTVSYKWMVLSNTTFGQLMSGLDANIIIVALPVIGRELPGVSALDLIWVVIGYQLVISSVLVNFGRLGDIFGRVRLYRFGFVFFTIGSALCSLSQSGQQLVAFRFVQGGGAALLTANATAIITDTFPANERGRALGTNQVAVASGSVLGLVVGGVLTSTIGWRSIFWVNVPIGVIAIVWSQFHLKEIGRISRGQEIDLPGNVTFLVALTTILAGATFYALNVIGEQLFAILLIVSLVFFALFVYVERNVRDPMLSLELFRRASFTLGNSSVFLNTLARGTILLVLTFYLQGPSMKFDPLLAGLFITPNAASIVLLGPLSGWLSDRHGPRLFTTLGSVLSGIGCLMLAQLGPTASFPEIAVPLVLNGAGIGMFSSPNRASVMNAVPTEQRGVASGAYMTSMYVGNTLSRGLAFLMMGLVLPASILQAIFSGSSQAAGAEAVGLFVSSIHFVFYVSSALLLVTALLSAFGFSKRV